MIDFKKDIISFRLILFIAILWVVVAGILIAYLLVLSGVEEKRIEDACSGLPECEMYECFADKTIVHREKTNYLLKEQNCLLRKQKR